MRSHIHTTWSCDFGFSLDGRGKYREAFRRKITVVTHELSHSAAWAAHKKPWGRTEKSHQPKQKLHHNSALHPAECVTCPPHSHSRERDGGHCSSKWPNAQSARTELPAQPCWSPQVHRKQIRDCFALIQSSTDSLEQLQGAWKGSCPQKSVSETPDYVGKQQLPWPDYLKFHSQQVPWPDYLKLHSSAVESETIPWY